MLNLTFGEQVKIVLSRKGMTIKELAEIIEERTGKKMSRQNLTQRLGRDNFQEQDMRMIADILGCSFQLSILASLEDAEKVAAVEVKLPTEQELKKIEKKPRKVKEEPEMVSEVTEPAPVERDITIGELVDIHEGLSALEEAVQPEEIHEAFKAVENEPIVEESVPEEVYEPEVSAEEPEEVICEEPEAAKTVYEESVPEAYEQQVGTFEPIVEEEPVAEEVPVVEEAAAEPEKETVLPVKEKKRGIFKNYLKRPFEKEVKQEEPVKEEPVYRRTEPVRHEEVRHEVKPEPTGDINPYTGLEYETNSVRIHPKRIGYVQVYDRGDHTWTDMTEWAFLGYQERKKALLGKDYDPPIYLD